MRMLLRCVFASLSLLAAAPPASAGGGPNGSPSGTVDWSGLYAGLHGGYVWGHQDVSLDRSSLKLDGWLGGGHIGLQRQLHHWVFGLEGAFTGGTLEGSRSVAPGTDLEASVRNIFLFTGRAGYAWKDRLFYVKGGYASADVDVANGSRSSGSRLHGWTAGAGFERKLTRNVSIGIEYNYIDLGGKTLGVDLSAPTAAKSVAPPTDNDPTPPTKPKTRLDPDGIHTVMARLTFALGEETTHTPYK